MLVTNQNIKLHKRGIIINSIDFFLLKSLLISDSSHNEAVSYENKIEHYYQFRFVV